MQGLATPPINPVELQADLAPAATAPIQAIAEPANAAGLTNLPDNPEENYKYGARGIEFNVAAKVNGVPAGQVPLLIADGENFSVRLADVLSAIEPAMDKSMYDRLSASQSADDYVTFNVLRQAGIAVGFDANDQLILGSK